MNILTRRQFLPAALLGAIPAAVHAATKPASVPPQSGLSPRPPADFIFYPIPSDMHRIGQVFRVGRNGALSPVTTADRTEIRSQVGQAGSMHIRHEVHAAAHAEIANIVRTNVSTKALVDVLLDNVGLLAPDEADISRGLVKTLSTSAQDFDSVRDHLGRNDKMVVVGQMLFATIRVDIRGISAVEADLAFSVLGGVLGGKASRETTFTFVGERLAYAFAPGGDHLIADANRQAHTARGYRV